MLGLTTSFLLALATRLKRGGVIINGHTLSRQETTLQISILRRWFDFVGLEELPGRWLRPGKRPFCLLTFDDGKRNNYTEIAPELERQRAPAVFYVTTDFITTGRCLWFDQHRLLVKHLGYCPSGLELETLKRLPFDALTRRLDAGCARNRFEPDISTDDVRPMSWDEVRDLAARGFGIGAHGLNHTILTQEADERAFAEIELSIAKLISELGVACRSFAFPNGNYTLKLAQYAIQCGATTVMTTEPAWVDRRADLWRLPRIQLFGGFTRSRTELKLALAALRGALANPDGSGRAYGSPFRWSAGWPRRPSAQDRRASNAF